MLMLLCQLADAKAQPLTMTEFRHLEHRFAGALPGQDGEVTARVLCGLGLPSDEAERVERLLDREEKLDRYLLAAERRGIEPVTRLDVRYPARLLQKLGERAPAVLFVMGDAKLLSGDCISLVGARDLSEDAEDFAQRVGALCAKENYTLCSGGARGADRMAQTICHTLGGRALIFVADRLIDHVPEANTVYCSLDGCELPFSAARAHTRNRLIHAMGQLTFVAQAHLRRGGSWAGTAENLRLHLSPVYCHDDGSEAMQSLHMLGANLLPLEALQSVRSLVEKTCAENANTN